MHGLPRDVDLSFLVGATLLQVCIGANEVILNFDRQIAITIESEFRVGVSGREAIYESAPESAGDLAELLSCAVVDCVGSEDGTLGLTFSSGGVVEIYDSSSEFESYQVRHGGKVLAV